MFSLSAEIEKSLEPIIGASLFPVSPKTSRTNAVSDDVEKSLMRKMPGNCLRVCLVSFWHAHSSDRLPLQAGASTGRAGSDAGHDGLGVCPAGAKFF
jgi:hypothetical protein